MNFLRENIAATFTLWMSEDVRFQTLYAPTYTRERILANTNGQKLSKPIHCSFIKIKSTYSQKPYISRIQIPDRSFIVAPRRARYIGPSARESLHHQLSPGSANPLSQPSPAHVAHATAPHLPIAKEPSSTSFHPLAPKLELKKSRNESANRIPPKRSSRYSFTHTAAMVVSSHSTTAPRLHPLGCAPRARIANGQE